MAYSDPRVKSKPCVVCDTSFEYIRRDAKYCSAACQQYARNQRMPKTLPETKHGTCERCKKPFEYVAIPSLHLKRYCSDTCIKRASADKHRDKQLAKRRASRKPAPTCELCGLPTKRRNKTGVCQRTRDCTNEYKRRTYAMRPKPVGKTCELCSRPLHSSCKHGICDKTPECRHELNKRRHQANGGRKKSTVPGKTRKELAEFRKGKSCAICGKRRKKMVVDHDHKTRVIRGVLCSQCNVAIGMFDDNVNQLLIAVEYLSVSRRDRLTLAS
jgi:hypothetical protein